jgi:hypothetical protein
MGDTPMVIQHIHPFCPGMMLVSKIIRFHPNDMIFVDEPCLSLRIRRRNPNHDNEQFVGFGKNIGHSIVGRNINLPV